MIGLKTHYTDLEFWESGDIIICPRHCTPLDIYASFVWGS